MVGQRSLRIVLLALVVLLSSGCGETVQQRPRQEETARNETVQWEAARNQRVREETIPQNERLSYDVQPTVVKNNVFLGRRNVGGLSATGLSAQLMEYAAKKDKAPVNAVLTKSWAVKSGKAGKKLNVEKTVSALLNARQGARLGYVFETVQPEVTSAQLKKNINVIGRYTTILLDRRASRVNNILLASKKINNTVLQPGEEFSFNRIVGRRTSAKGYEEAPIIIHTPLGPAKKNANGGGICQISTTIYNAVEACGLKVTERHMHSKMVGYVPKGEDATVFFGSVDFKFVNSRQNPIMIKVYVGAKRLKVRILENSSGQASAP